MQSPKALKRGDTIGIAATASPFDKTLFHKGVLALKHLGFEVYHQKDIFDQNRYLAGTDERRAEEFMSLMADKDIAAVMFARGGYGSQRVIPLLDPEKLRKHPKPVVGFSDLTAFLTFLRQSCGLPTFYGPVITQLGKCAGPVTGESLFKALTSQGPIGAIPLEDAKVLRRGSASGKLVGGCLSLINSSIGTPYELDTTDSVLFIEEIGEKVYVLDRMLTQLKNSGCFGRARAVVFGSIVPTPGETHDSDETIRDILGDFAGPVITNIPAGHIDNFITLPLGAEVEISAPEDAPASMTFKSGLLT